MALQIQMNSREKYVVGFGSVVVVSIIVFQFIISPFIDGRKAREKQILQLEKQISEMRALKTEYEQLTAGGLKTSQRTGRVNKDFTLFSFLEKLSGTTKIKDNISYMKPSTSTSKETNAQLSLVKIKFNQIVMEQLINFLHGVETSPHMIFVRGISISRAGKDNKFLNVVLQLETVKRLTK